MEGDTEIAPHQIAFDLPETSTDPSLDTKQATHQDEKKVTEEVKDMRPKKGAGEYRPYCGEGHGKMIPSKFGGFWCPKCRGS